MTHQTTDKPEWMTYPTAERMAPRHDMRLVNPDLAPVDAERRTWNWWHIASLWIGMAICIPTYTLASGLIDQGWTWQAAVGAVILGNVVVLVPIALNSGLFWPRRSLRRFPGTVVAEILDPIAPGLDKETFFARLQNDIEAATARLIAEGRAKVGGG